MLLSWIGSRFEEVTSMSVLDMVKMQKFWDVKMWSPEPLNAELSA